MRGACVATGRAGSRWERAEGWDRDAARVRFRSCDIALAAWAVGARGGSDACAFSGIGSLGRPPEVLMHGGAAC